jgi:hypothetical protein
MRWFRDTLRQGSWLALIALAINLGLSFGHIHAIEGQVSGPGVATMATSIVAPDQGHPDGGHADYLCPICMAATAMASALASVPPALPLQFADVTIDRVIAPVFARVEPPPAAFQSRGPPIS